MTWRTPSRSLPFLTATCAAALLVLLVAVGADVGADSGKKAPHRAHVSVLYVLDAGHATLVPQHGSTASFRLALKQPQREGVWFSDRPQRKSGTFPARPLAGEWAGFAFAADPPNVALDYQDARGRDRTAMLTLRKPGYRGTRSFDARLLKPAAVGDRDLASPAATADVNPPRQMRAVALFIDDTTAPVIEGCILQPFTVCPKLRGGSERRLVQSRRPQPHHPPRPILRRRLLGSQPDRRLAGRGHLLRSRHDRSEPGRSQSGPGPVQRFEPPRRADRRPLLVERRILQHR